MSCRDLGGNMNCPFCSHGETKVTDKRLAEDGRNRRRRECMKCGKRFTTYEKSEGLLTKVMKRDGNTVDFNKEKITNAIWAAAESVGGQDRETAVHLSDRVVERIEEKFGGVTVPTVEQIQDIAEKVLVEEGHYKTAKAFILYREQHKKLRETKSVMVDVVNTIGEYLDQTDWRVKENSNEAFSFSGLLLHTAGKVMTYYNLNQMYTPEIAEAHKKGYFHIHDLSHGVIGYCCGHSLKNLLIMGFGGVRNKTECKPAKHLSTVVHQMVNYIGCLQMEFAGAQAFSVHPKETVVMRNRAGNISIERIGDFCDKFVEGNPERWLGPNGIEFADISNTGYETLSFGEDGKSQWMPIRRVIRHPVTDPLHLLRTNKGIISASKSHSLFSLNSHQYLGLKERLLLESMENNGKKLFSYELGDRAKELGIKAPEKVVQKLVARGLLDSALLNYDGEARRFAKYTVRENKKRFVLKKTEELNRFSKEVKTGDTGASNLAVLSKVSLPENEEVDLYDIIRESRKSRKLVLVKIDDTKQLKKDIMAKTSMRKLSFEMGKSRGYVYSMLKRGKVPFEIYDRFTSVKEKGIKFTTNRNANAISRILNGEELTSFAKLIAWYLSEGYATKYWIGIVQKDENNIREILRILDSLSTIYHISKREVKSIIIHGIAAVIIKELCSRHSDNKKIPSFVFALGSRLKKAFLEEIAKGDGTKTERGWIYTSTSNLLVTGLNLLAINLGMKTSIKTRCVENYEKNLPGRLTRYDLVLNDAGAAGRTESHGDFESAVIFENHIPDSEPEYEYDLSVEGTESFVGGVGLFAMHNSSVDTLLAPFIRADNLPFKDVKQAMQQLVFSLNIPSRWGCFSDDTEILTKDGWRSGLDLNAGDIIATFNPKTEKIEYLPVLKMTKDHYAGKMLNLKNRITDQLVTPNHRVLRRIHNYQEGISPSKYVFEEAAKLKTKIPLIPLGGNFEGADMNEDKVKLLSWIVSEGSLCEDERIAIHQSAEVNPENCEEIRDILGRLEIPFDESMKLSGFTGKRNCTRFWLNRPESKNIYSQFFPSYRKLIPRTMSDISTGLSRSFIDTYMKADGWAPENKIYTKKKEDADMMQEMITKTGWGSTLSLNKNGMYVVRVIKHNYTQVDDIEEVDYDGMVWCPTTVNGTVVVRRNGKVFISGNSQYPFSNITFDWMPPEDMRNQKAIVGGKEMPYTYSQLQPEMDMINKAFLEVMLEGDAKGGVFTFPIPTYNLTKDFDWSSENARLLFDLTAKYGLPYFQNYVGSGLDPSSIRAMCCRLNINQKELMSRPGGMWGPGDSTGSIGVVTINVNRLAYEARKATEETKTEDVVAKAKDEYFAKLKYYMTLAKNSLETKREVVDRNLEKGLMPYTKRYLGTFKNHFSTIGLCGMNEACLNALGKDIASPDGKQFAIDTLQFMRGMCLQFQNETQNLYNLEATPAESTAYRLAKLDKQVYPDIITAGKNEPYLTNSTQLPVDYTEDAILAIEHQNDIQPLYTGGTIFHLFVGERITDGETCKKLVKKVAENTRLPYFTITPTFSICPEHGYVKGEHFVCPMDVGDTTGGAGAP